MTAAHLPLASYQHWRIQSGLLATTVYFDEADSPVNRLNQATMTELGLLLKQLAADPDLKAVVFRSAKTKGFIAGADVSEFKQLMDVNEAIAKVRIGQQVFNQIANLPVPTIAVIQGFCLGGGLELALACDYRIVDDNPKTKLGVPEVMVGIHPGWGGSTRLPKLVGPLTALDLMLTGRLVNGKTAKTMGLVDFTLPLRDMDRAIDCLLTTKPPVHRPVWWQRLLNLSPLRPVVAGFMRRQLAKKVHEAQYPAPFAILNGWQRYGGQGEAATIAEAQSVAKLVVTDTSKQLVRVFFLRERLRGLGKIDSAIHHVHVIGAGTMGGDIAAWCALQGLQVTLEDSSLSQLGKSMARATQLFKRKLKQPHQIQAARDRLCIDLTGAGRRRADLIIEAIVEDLALKRALWQDVVKVARADALLATNTSSLSLTAITAGWEHPYRLVGIHFFNPVAQMPLVEVVTMPETDANVVMQVLAFVKQIDKLPLPVANMPGFLVNRVLSAYLMAAISQAMQGQSYASIDAAAVAYGMPIGPIELADTVGLDVCLAAAESLAAHMPMTIPAVLRKKVQAGELGKKTGRGFYRYIAGKRVSKAVSPSTVSPLLTAALIQPLLAEAKAALAAGVVADADLVDAGMIFGAGFPPFRGTLFPSTPRD